MTASTLLLDYLLAMAALGILLKSHYFYVCGLFF